MDAASEMESLGYSTFWSSGGFEPGLSNRFERLLAATSSVKVASGIVSVWKISAPQLAEAAAELEAKFPGRFLAGLGVSHAPRVENYVHPYSKMVQFLDAIDDASPTLAKDRRILAALGPRMIALARDRSLGAHPYFVPVEYMAIARSALGDSPLLASEVTVILEKDPMKARERARTFTTHYLALPNYSNNLRNMGYEESDLSGAGSDRLVDAIVCWGTLDDIVEKLRGYLDAGADHIGVQVLPESSESFPYVEYRELASALLHQ
jgi:probable F420-dependent oxidoreductase